MDILVITFSASAILCTFLFVIRRRATDNLPPGSFGWPFLGETIEFLWGKPDVFVGNRMKKHSRDIFKTKILGEKTAVLCGPKGNKFLFTNEHKYFTEFRPHSMQYLFRFYERNAPTIAHKDSAEAAAAARNDETKKMINQPGFLKPEALMQYIGKMDSIIQEQLGIHFRSKEIVGVNAIAKNVTLSLACHLFLGINNPERISRLVKCFDQVTLGMHAIMLNIPGTVFYRANQGAMHIKRELAAVIQEKKQALAKGSPPRDILSHMVLITGPSGNTMPEEEIACKIMGFLTAGYSTVATAITFMMKYIGLYPEIYEKVRAEHMDIAASKKEGELLEWNDMNKMKYSWNVVKEVLRLVPPLQGTFREVVADFEYGGYTVPKGWKVYWTVSTTNMNPEYFNEPEKFNPSRYDKGEMSPPPYAQVPFGGGPRLCPGKEYARVAILAFLHNVVKKYRWEVLYPNEKVEGDMMPEPQKGLPIRVHPCSD